MSASDEPRNRPLARSDRRLELLAYLGILTLAAFLRLGSNLAMRGSWDADQGHDMLVLRALVLDGRIPLLGPPTSIGDFHHGMLYYLLLAPAAALSHADPVAVTTWIALGGVAAVAVTGWLARSIAGPIAGLLAALLLAVSSSAIEESTFIWNPNLIALSSSIALAAAWHAWRTRSPRWWLLAGIAAVVTMQCHVLGVVLTPVIGGLLVADVRRRQRAGDASGARAVGRATLGWLAIAILSYVPLAIHELGNDASELRAAIAFLTGAAGTTSIALPVRIPIVGLRVLGWPLAGLITAAPVATVLASALVIGLAVWRGWVAGDERDLDGWASRGEPTPADERIAVRWLSLGLAWTVIALPAGASQGSPGHPTSVRVTNCGGKTLPDTVLLVLRRPSPTGASSGTFWSVTEIDQSTSVRALRAMSELHSTRFRRSGARSVTEAWPFAHPGRTYICR